MDNPHPAAAPLTQTDTRWRWLLFCVLLGVYLLVYVSAPTSIDGQAILAVAANAVQHSSADIGVLGAPEALLPLPARMGSFGPDGALYSKKGPTPSLALVPLVTAAHFIPGLPIQATAMLFNPLILALTAVAVYTFVRRLGFRPITALVTGLILGLATFGLTYAKTLFAEPLAGLLLTWALLGAYEFRHGTAARPARVLINIGLLLGLAAGINLTYLVMIPLFGLYLFGWRLDRAPRHALLTWGAPLAAALIALGLYNWARFGSLLTSGYNFDQGEGFNRPLLYGLYGLFLSPYRGVFWYNPVLLLAIPGAIRLRARVPRLTWTILALIAAQAVTYASWWSWHGGIVWGPRFLLPVVPLAALLLAPIVERALTQRIPVLHVALALLVVLSVGIQIEGALYSYFVYTGYLQTQYGTGTLEGIVSAVDERVMVDPTLSPLIGHLALLKAHWAVEPAWAAHGIDALHLLAALALIALGGLLLVRRVPLTPLRRIALPVILACLLIVAARQRSASAYQAVHALETDLRPRGTIVAATTLFGANLLDVDNGAHVISMNAPTTPDDPLAAGLWTFAKRQSHLLWLVTWFPPAQAENWQAVELWQQDAFVREVSVAGHRALLFDLAPAPDPDRTDGTQFGPLRLEAYGVRVTDDGVQVTVQWSAAETVAQNYTWFIHLIDGAGNVIGQQDRAPLGGYAPTSTWTPGQPVVDRLFFPLPAHTNTSGWQLRVGYVDPASGERLTMVTAAGEPVPDGYILLPLN